MLIAAGLKGEVHLFCTTLFFEYFVEFGFILFVCPVCSKNLFFLTISTKFLHNIPLKSFPL